MSATLGKLNFFQTCMILMLAIGLSSHVIVNPMVLESSGRDAWIAILLTALIYVPWCVMLVIFMKRSNKQKLQPWLASRTNRFVSWLIIVPLWLQIYAIGCSTLIYTVTWSTTYYLPDTPKFFMVATLGVVSFFYARSGLRAIAYSAGILLPIVVVLGYFVSFANMPQKDYSLLKPMLEHGWQPAVNGILYAGGGFIELIMIIVVQHKLRARPKLWQVLILACILVYITIGPIIGAITEFGYAEAAKQFESPYEQWRLVKLGNDIEHVDFLSLFQWLAGAVIRISFALFLIAELMPIPKSQTRNIITLIIALSFIIIALVPIERYTFYMWMSNYYFPVSLAVGLTVSVLCFVISLLPQSAKEGAA